MTANELDHTIILRSTMEPIYSLEMHVLARAYRAAWRSIHAREPMNRHVLEDLGVIIVFGAPPQDRATVKDSRD
jgi:hypothetical protein